MEQLKNVTGEIRQTVEITEEIGTLFDWLNYDNATVYVVPKQKLWLYELNSSFCDSPSDEILKELEDWMGEHYKGYKYHLD